MGNQGFIDPDGIFAYQIGQIIRLFVLEVANGFDTKRIVEQIKRNLMASYNGLIGEKYDLPQTAVILVALEHPEMMKNTLQRIKEDALLQKFADMGKYLFLGLQSELKEIRDSKWLDIDGQNASPFELPSH
jgi:hypothetical protein